MRATFELTGNKDVDISMRALLSTYEGEIPGERGFGIKPDILDKNPNDAKNSFALDLQEKIREFIPGYEVDDIDFTISDDGKITANIKLKEGGEN
mgnify:CR=1 FL=1